MSNKQKKQFNQTDLPGGRRAALSQQRQAKEAAAERARRAIKAAWVVGLAIIVGMVGVTIWAVASAKSSSTGTTGAAAGTLTVPATGTEAGAVVLGSTAAKVTVSVYADFMCPWCGKFERANGDAIAAAVNAGTTKLEIHPMAFLDDSSAGGRYSSRAANAFVTVANADTAAALKFYQLLYANQPAEGSTGLTDEQLVQLAQQAGAPAGVTATFAQQTYQPWIQQLTKQAFDSGITGTPTVKINGQLFEGDLYNAGPFAAAIDQAVANA